VRAGLAEHPVEGHNWVSGRAGKSLTGHAEGGTEGKGKRLGARERLRAAWSENVCGGRANWDPAVGGVGGGGTT